MVIYVMTPVKNGNLAAATAAATTTTTSTPTEKQAAMMAEQDPLTGGVARKEIDIEEMSTCGIGSCQPKWARMFSSTHTFMIVFLLAWVLQVSSGRHFVIPCFHILFYSFS